MTDTITSTYNTDDELTQAVDANTGTTVYGYDANGSQTSVTHTPNGTTTPDSTTTNEYDLQGQLAGSQVTTSAGTATTTYFYDDSGNRIEELTVAAGSTTSVTTYYLVDANNPTGYSQPIEQSSTPGTPQITYIWGAQLIGETYATGATIPGVGTASSPTTYYLLQDAHGSTRLVTDANGNIVARYNYDGFGNALGFSAATALTTYLYSSMPYDAASGNYYDHARFYDSGTGSFTQSDYGYSGSLANPMTDLPYAFTGGDPINMLDLSGHGFMDLMVSLSIQAIFTAISVPALAGATSLLTGGGFWGGVGNGSVAGLAIGFLVIKDGGLGSAKFWDDFSGILFDTALGTALDSLVLWAKDPEKFNFTPRLANDLFWQNLTTFSEAASLKVGFDSSFDAAVATAGTRSLIDSPALFLSLKSNLQDELTGKPTDWAATRNEAFIVLVDTILTFAKGYVNEGLPSIANLPEPVATIAKFEIWGGWDALLRGIKG